MIVPESEFFAHRFFAPSVTAHLGRGPVALRLNP